VLVLYRFIYVGYLDYMLLLFTINYNRKYLDMIYFYIELGLVL